MGEYGMVWGSMELYGGVWNGMGDTEWYGGV